MEKDKQSVGSRTRSSRGTDVQAQSPAPRTEDATTAPPTAGSELSGDTPARPKLAQRLRHFVARNMGRKGDEVSVARGSETGSVGRGHWARHLEFVLSAMGYCIGLGNLWRFPYLCYANGGGAFLLPYFLALAVVGVPLFYLESALGQFCSRGSNVAWARLCPLFRGIGWGCISVAGMLSVYYNTVIAWCVVYLLYSFEDPMPWATCKNVSYASPMCYTNLDSEGFCGPNPNYEHPPNYCSFWLNQKQYRFSCASVQFDADKRHFHCDNVTADTVIDLSKLHREPDVGARYWNASSDRPHWVDCLPPANSTDSGANATDFGANAVHSGANATHELLTNLTDERVSCLVNASTFFHDVAPIIDLRMPGEDFFLFGLYHQSPLAGLHLGSIDWSLMVAAIVVWVITYCCVMFGVQSIGKVVFFTALFPFVMIFILFVAGVTKPNASEGLLWYLTPRFGRLLEPKAWYLAASQVVYSLSICQGGLTGMASYNEFDTNIWRDTVIITLTNCFASLFAGAGVFSMLGYLRLASGRPVHSVVSEGKTLVFAACSDALTRWPVGRLWCVLFFFTLITLGIDSQFMLVETLTTAILDEAPSLRRYKPLVVLATCVTLFLLSIPTLLKGGNVIVDLFDSFAAIFGVFLLGALQPLVISHIYGIKRFMGDLEMMMGAPRNWRKIVADAIGPYSWYFRASWMFIAPFFLFAMFIAACVQQHLDTHEVDPKTGAYVIDLRFPANLWVLGFVLALLPVIVCAAFAVYTLVDVKVRQHRPFTDTLRPTSHWGIAMERGAVGKAEVSKTVHRRILPGISAEPTQQSESNDSRAPSAEQQQQAAARSPDGFAIDLPDKKKGGGDKPAGLKTIYIQDSAN